MNDKNSGRTENWMAARNRTMAAPTVKWPHNPGRTKLNRFWISHGKTMKALAALEIGWPHGIEPWPHELLNGRTTAPF